MTEIQKLDIEDLSEADREVLLGKRKIYEVPVEERTHRTYIFAIRAIRSIKTMREYTMERDIIRNVMFEHILTARKRGKPRKDIEFPYHTYFSTDITEWEYVKSAVTSF